MKRAVVVGSGLAGLAAAYRLQEAGWTVRVLEASGRIGGRVLSHEVRGFVLDVGPTLVTDKYAEYMKLVHELGLGHLVVDSSAVIGVVKGRDLHLLDTRKPVRSFLRTRLLSPMAKLRLILRGARLLRPLWGLNPYDLTNRLRYDVESMDDYLERVFGRELNEAFLDAVARGMTLSTTARASVIEFFAGMVAASGTMQNIVGGLEVLPRALAQRLDVTLDATVTSVRHCGAGVVVEYQDATGASRSETADGCIITTRFADAVELYPPLKETGSGLLEATEYLGCYSLQLMYDRRTERKPFIVMVPESASREVCAVFLEHVKAPDRAPAGASQLTVFFNLNSDVDFATWSDQQLTRTGRDFVEALFPELHGHFQADHLTRWAYAAHQGNVGYYQALGNFLAAHPNTDPVQVAGDYMSVAGQESAVVAGVNTARRLIRNG